MPDILYAHKDRRGPGGGFWFGPREAVDGPWEDRLEALVDQALIEENSRQTPRAYLGGSRLGMECLRALAFEWHHQEAEYRAYLEATQAGQTPPRRNLPFGGRALRRFRLGHLQEDETARWLQIAGMDLRTVKDDGRQFGFAVAWDATVGRYRLAGHIDGVILSSPVPEVPVPALWEHKIMNSKKWREFVSKGVEKSHPIYYYQCQTYMAYMELHNALFTAFNTDTSELWHELIPFNADHAQWATDRGVQVLESGAPEELPRIARDPSDFRCKFCDYHALCWSQPTQSATPAKPAWL